MDHLIELSVHFIEPKLESGPVKTDILLCKDHYVTKFSEMNDKERVALRSILRGIVEELKDETN